MSLGKCIIFLSVNTRDQGFTGSGLRLFSLEKMRLIFILPEAYVEQYGRDLRRHTLNPDTKMFEGTLGANREAREESYHLYKKKLVLMLFLTKMETYSEPGLY